MTADDRYCTREAQRLTNLTDEQIRSRQVPCPRCGRLLNVVPNAEARAATIKAHMRPEAPVVASGPAPVVATPPTPAAPAEESLTGYFDDATKLVDEWLESEHGDPRGELIEEIERALESASDNAKDAARQEGYDDGEKDGKEEGKREALEETPEAEARLVDLVRDLSGNPTLSTAEEAFEWLTAQRDQRHRADLRYLNAQKEAANG